MDRCIALTNGLAIASFKGHTALELWENDDLVYHAHLNMVSDV